MILSSVHSDEKVALGDGVGIGAATATVSVVVCSGASVLDGVFGRVGSTGSSTSVNWAFTAGVVPASSAARQRRTKGSETVIFLASNWLLSFKHSSSKCLSVTEEWTEHYFTMSISKRIWFIISIEILVYPLAFNAQRQLLLLI